MLTALYKTGRQTENRQYYWMCKCDCGNLTEIRIGNITTGRTKSCGCLQKRKGKESPNWKHGISIKKGTQEHKIYQRECYDRFKYGLEPEHKQALLDKQNGCCAICGKHSSEVETKLTSKLAIDHCHTTGKVRALLCLHCNNLLTYIFDKLHINYNNSNMLRVITGWNIIDFCIILFLVYKTP